MHTYSILVIADRFLTYLPDCLASLLQQTTQEFEIVCAGGEEAEALVNALPESEHICFVKCGADEDPLQAAQEQLNGEWVYILHPEVCPDPELLEKAGSFAGEQDADLVLMAGRVSDREKEEVKEAPEYLKPDVKKAVLREGQQCFTAEEAGEQLFQLAVPAFCSRLFRRGLLSAAGTKRHESEVYQTSLLYLNAAKCAVYEEPLFTVETSLKPGDIFYNKDYWFGEIGAIEELFYELKERKCPEGIRRSWANLATARLSPAVQLNDRKRDRSAVYNRLKRFYDRTGLLKRPEEDFSDVNALKQLKAVPHILEAEALLYRKQHESSCKVVKEAENIQNPLVSVVIPVYNVEDYVGECLQSVCGQSLKDLEIICVNDGSTDGSLAAVCKAADADPRIRVYTEENSGQATARNAGAKLARGKYLYFIDSDDLIEPDALEALTARAEADELDLLLFDGLSFTDEESLQGRMPHYRHYYIRDHRYPGVMSGQEMFRRMDEHNEYRVQPCMMLFRREAFLEAELWFPHGFIHEDNAFAFRVFLKMQRVGHTPEVYYKRRLRPDSVMTSKTSFRNVFGYYYTFKDMEQALAESGETEDTYAFLHELYYTATVMRKRYRELPVEEQPAYLVLPDADRRQFELLTADVERVRASESRLKARLKKADQDKAKLKAGSKKNEDELKKLREKLKKAEDQNRVLNERNKALLKKLTDIGRSKPYRIGKGITWLPRKIRDGLKK